MVYYEIWVCFHCLAVFELFFHFRRFGDQICLRSFQQDICRFRESILMSRPQSNNKQHLSEGSFFTDQFIWLAPNVWGCADYYTDHVTCIRGYIKSLPEIEHNCQSKFIMDFMRCMASSFESIHPLTLYVSYIYIYCIHCILSITCTHGPYRTLMKLPCFSTIWL